MTLREIINKLLRRQPASASTARERLQLVLAHDRSDLSTELLDQMRREILEVVARYVEIDMNEGAVSLETEDRMTALVANLPIKTVKQQLSPEIIQELRVYAMDNGEKPIGGYNYDIPFEQRAYQRSMRKKKSSIIKKWKACKKVRYT